MTARTSFTVVLVALLVGSVVLAIAGHDESGGAMFFLFMIAWLFFGPSEETCDCDRSRSKD